MMTKLSSSDCSHSELLKRAVELKSHLSRTAAVIDDNETLMIRQQLRNLLMKIILDDLVFALDNKLEQDLWNFVFKGPISVMQSTTKDKKHPDFKKLAAVLNAFLDSALGFYTLLLKKVSLVYKIDLEFMPCHGVSHTLTNDGSFTHISQPLSADISPESATPTIAPSVGATRTNSQSAIAVHGAEYGADGKSMGGGPHCLSSCHCLVQDCLVRMGDLARYRSKPQLAEIVYRHALHLVPSSGQPYNQLALLATQYGDRISPLYYYIRSVTVRTPFAAAAQNLSRLYNRLAAQSTQSSIDAAELLSGSEYMLLFLQLHARFYQLVETGCTLSRPAGSWCTAAAATLVRQLPRLLLEEAFSLLQLVQMLVVCIYGVHHATSLSPSPAVPLSWPAEQLLRLLCGVVCGLLRVTYRLHELEQLRQYPGLAAVKLFISWLLQSDSLLSQPVFSNVHCPIWPLLCNLANRLNNNEKKRDDNDDSLYLLPEDEELRSFTLIPSLSSTSSSMRASPALVPLYRCRQLLQLCRRLELCHVLEPCPKAAGAFSCRQQELGEEELVNTPAGDTGDSSAFGLNSAVKRIDQICLTEGQSVHLPEDQTVAGHGILKYPKPVSAIGSGWRRSQNVAMATIFRGIDSSSQSAIDSHADVGCSKQVKFSAGSRGIHGGYMEPCPPSSQAANATTSLPDTSPALYKRRFSPPPRFKQQQQQLTTTPPLTSSTPIHPASFNPAVPPPLPSAVWSREQDERGPQAVSMLGSGDAGSPALYSLFPPSVQNSSQTFWPMTGPSPLETLIQQQQQQQQKRRDNSLNPL